MAKTRLTAHGVQFWSSVFAFCLILAGGSADAQDRSMRDAPALSAAVSGENAEALRPLVDRLAGNVVERETVPGLIVGVSWHGRRSFFGYSAGGDAPYGSDTIVEIGSITKVFTTALFAEAVLEGRMQRDAPIQSYLPNRTLHPCAGQVTPLQLADFTSGMPTLPGNAPRQLAQRGIENYTSADFLTWVERWTPEGSEAGACQLPAAYRYSNARACFGLLESGFA